MGKVGEIIHLIEVQPACEIILSTEGWGAHHLTPLAPNQCTGLPHTPAPSCCVYSAVLARLEGRFGNRFDDQFARLEGVELDMLQLLRCKGGADEVFVLRAVEDLQLPRGVAVGVG